MAIKITENGVVRYENEPNIDRELFPNTVEGGSPEQIAQAVDEWLENHPEATTTVTDGSITREKLDSELNSYIEDITNLKSAIDDPDIISINGLPKHNGMINSSGLWANINSNYQHILLPIKSGDAIEILPHLTANTFIAFLTAYIHPVQGASASFSAQTGFTGRIALNHNNSPVTYTAPSDAVYLYILLISNTTVATPRTCIVNGYDYAVRFITHYLTDTANLANGIQDNLDTYYDGVGQILENSKKKKYNAVPNSSGKWAVSDTYESVVFAVNGGEAFSITASSNGGLFIAALTDFSDPINGASLSFSSATDWTGRVTISTGATLSGNLPSDARYVLVILKNGSVQTAPVKCIIDDIDYVKNVYDNMRDLIGRNVNWCSMGDSIAYGTRSYMDGDTPRERNDPQLSWAHAVSEKNHFNWTNIAIPGGGYLYASEGRVAGYALARSTDYTPYNLVTIAYGINDWKGGSPLGTVNDDPTAVTPTTTLQAMKSVIKAIMDSNPLCKIIVLLPLNCHGYEFSYGDFSTNYALGYTNATNGKTLEEFVQGMIEVCEYYGIQYIDNAHTSFVNRLNLPSALLDGVHPSQEAHALLGAELADKITFK